ncbi:hypothetical protein Patl1_09004 [Pistacia atlantica]|uniref:Uncharacterized protein n=1 Tax=Pistacia atlantica TaxID=434234 RepID=A0ACC1AHP4_9ROSI|nr:hypothetical protein Patl1_09004 [Pistacia atlantica]
MILISSHILNCLFSDRAWKVTRPCPLFGVDKLLRKLSQCVWSGDNLSLLNYQVIYDSNNLSKLIFS